MAAIEQDGRHELEAALSNIAQLEGKLLGQHEVTVLNSNSGQHSIWWRQPLTNTMCCQCYSRPDELEGDFGSMAYTASGCHDTTYGQYYLRPETGEGDFHVVRTLLRANTSHCPRQAGGHIRVVPGGYN